MAWLGAARPGATGRGVAARRLREIEADAGERVVRLFGDDDGPEGGAAAQAA